MELIDMASDEAKQAAVKTAGGTVQLAVRVAGGSAGLGADAVVAVTRRLLAAARAAAHEQRTTGRISVRDFGRTISGTRELVTIDERQVTRELNGALKRYGVTFAIEANRDGTRTFHVQGKDVQVVERALAAASERVDQQITRNATRQRLADKISAGVDEKKSSRKPTPTRRTGPDMPIPEVGDNGDDAPQRPGPTR